MSGEPATVECQVEAVEPLAGAVQRVWLRPPAGWETAYRPGQYLELVDGDERFPFSLAARPQPGRALELHIGHVPGSASAQRVQALLAPGARLSVAVGGGDCVLPAAASGPIVFLASGTGFAPMKALIEEALTRGWQDLWLYWGGRGESDLYLAALARQWAAEHAGFHFEPCADTRDNAGAPNSGAFPLVEKVLEDWPQMGGLEVFASGSPALVYAALDAFQAAGLAPARMHSDVFAYAPRE